MPQNIDSTTRTIGLWCLAHKDDKYFTTFDLTQEFPNVARPRISGVLTRFCREGYLERVSRGFFKVVRDNVMEFERRLKPGTKEIELVAAISTDAYPIWVGLNEQLFSLNGLLVVGVAQLDETKFIEMLDFLDEYAKTVMGMVKYARANLENFTAPYIESEHLQNAQAYIEKHLS